MLVEITKKEAIDRLTSEIENDLNTVYFKLRHSHRRVVDYSWSFVANNGLDFNTTQFFKESVLKSDLKADLK